MSSLAVVDLVNQPLFTASTQFWYTDLPLAAGPTAEKVATDCRQRGGQAGVQVACQK